MLISCRPRVNRTVSAIVYAFGFVTMASVTDALNAPVTLRLKSLVGVFVTTFRIPRDRKSTRLNSSHGYISYAVFCLKKKNTRYPHFTRSNTMTPPPTNLLQHLTAATANPFLAHSLKKAKLTSDVLTSTIPHRLNTPN